MKMFLYALAVTLLGGLGGLFTFGASHNRILFFKLMTGGPAGVMSIRHGSKTFDAFWIVSISIFIVVLALASFGFKSKATVISLLLVYILTGLLSAIIISAI